MYGANIKWFSKCSFVWSKEKTGKDQHSRRLLKFSLALNWDLWAALKVFFASKNDDRI